MDGEREELGDMSSRRNAELGDGIDLLLQPTVPTAEEKKRRRDAAFSSYFIKRAATINEEGIKKALRAEEYEAMSLKAIMTRQVSAPIIENPREYQMELFQRAKEQNTIAVLDTGSGKTLIAVLLLRHYIDRELEDRAAGKPHRISFFLVDKVTLVFQQWAVLKANIDQNIEYFYGAKGCDTWMQETWTNEFAQNMIIVCTAEILYQCLAHAFITMEQINLLILDEAHHAKKDHTYARIIRDFYKSKAPTAPRIFGMTASPVDVDVQQSLQQRAQDLETLLHSRIATTSHWTVLSSFVHRPDPLFAQYDPPQHSLVESALYRQLWAEYNQVDHFQSFFKSAAEINRHLGRWCSDKFWSFAFLDGGSRKFESKIQQQVQKRRAMLDTSRMDAQIERFLAAHTTMSNYMWVAPTFSTENVTSKVIKLFELLRSIFEKPIDARCLVFVEQRATARLLHALSEHFGTEHLKAGILMGANGSNLHDYNYSIKEQVINVNKFRTGELNCLFATSVAEEGLDIQSCGWVIRFDPCKTMIQYIQSRGRARQKDSKFVHLIERRNFTEQDRVEDMKHSETMMREFCQNLAQKRLDTENNIDAGIQDKAEREYVEPVTGAKLTYDFSLMVLAHFVGSLPHEDGDDLSINYITTNRGGKFVCEVILPVGSPISRAIGREYRRTRTAKRSAAFEACLALRRGRYLDENLLPVYTRKKVAMRNAQLAITSQKSNKYAMLTKPELWQTQRGQLPELLFMTVLTLDAAWDQPVRALGLVTRTALPDLPSFPLFRIDGGKSEAVIISLSNGFYLDTTELSDLTGFTLAVYKDINNKTFEHKPSKMSYWLAPLKVLPAALDKELADPSQLVEWDTCARVSGQPHQLWDRGMPNEELSNRFVIDPYNGGRRWITDKVEPGLLPTDPVTFGKEGTRNKEHIMAYTLQHMWKRTRATKEWDETQPVIRAEEVVLRLNVLAQPTARECEVITNCFICPGPLRISWLPPDVVRMALLFPALLHRMESYLICLEFCQQVDLTIDPALALEAVTKDCDNTDNTEGERINFRHGMGPNYERLEFLGDCFLKMATSVSLFAKRVGGNEEEMHIQRMLMICNKNLFHTATTHEYFKYIRSRAFSRRTWYPEGLKLLEGKGAKGGELHFEATHALGDKTVADVCEAMIGAAFMTHFRSGYGNPTNMNEAVKAVSKFVDNGNHTMLQWADYYRAYELPKYQTAESNASQRNLACQVEQEHSYRFKYPRLLRSAFQHPSNPQTWEGLPSYQRLEFLGDALLDMTAVAYLFEKHPTRDAQWLTEHKMAMVSNKFLGALCVKLGFHRHLRHNTTSIEHQVRTFVEAIKLAEEKANGARDYWRNVKDVPKCLSDIVESYVGAMFVDSEFSYAEVQRFFDEHILWFFEDMRIYDTFANNHPVTRLHHILGEELGCYDFALRAQDIVEIGTGEPTNIALVIVHDQPFAEGVAASSRYSKGKAAVKAIQKLQHLSPAEFRAKYNCDCRPQADVAGQETIEVDKSTEAVADLEEAMGTAI